MHARARAPRRAAGPWRRAWRPRAAAAAACRSARARARASNVESGDWASPPQAHANPSARCTLCLDDVAAAQARPGDQSAPGTRGRTCCAAATPAACAEPAAAPPPAAGAAAAAPPSAAAGLPHRPHSSLTTPPRSPPGAPPAAPPPAPAQQRTRQRAPAASAAASFPGGRAPQVNVRREGGVSSTLRQLRSCNPRLSGGNPTCGAGALEHVVRLLGHLRVLRGSTAAAARAAQQQFGSPHSWVLHAPCAQPLQTAPASQMTAGCLGALPTHAPKTAPAACAARECRKAPNQALTFMNSCTLIEASAPKMLLMLLRTLPSVTAAAARTRTRAREGEAERTNTSPRHTSRSLSPFPVSGQQPGSLRARLVPTRPAAVSKHRHSGPRHQCAQRAQHAAPHRCTPSTNSTTGAERSATCESASPQHAQGWH